MILCSAGKHYPRVSGTNKKLKIERPDLALNVGYVIFALMRGSSHKRRICGMIKRLQWYNLGPAHRPKRRSAYPGKLVAGFRRKRSPRSRLFL